jgi:hypothetical protein
MKERGRRESARGALGPQERRAVQSVRRSDGAALDATLRSVLEPRFGHGLSDIRVHVEAAAAAAAEELGATAFTVDRDIAFAPGAYDPVSPAGQFLVAHEVAHAIQNAGASGGEALRARSNASDASEQDAHVAAEAVLAGNSASPSAAPSAVVSTYIPEWLLPHMPPMTGTADAAHAKADRFASLETANTVFDHAQSYDSAAEGYNSFGKVSQTTPQALKQRTPKWQREIWTPPPGNRVYGRDPGKLRRLPAGLAEGADGVSRIGSGTISAASGIANALGKTGAGNVLGGVSSAFSIAGGVNKLMNGDLNEQTEGAQDILANGFDLASSALGGPGTPLGAIAAAGGLGARVGQRLVNTSDAIAKERGYFHDENGNAQTGTAEAGDAGRVVDDLFGHSNPVLDAIGDGAGFITAGNAAITNAVYTYGRRGVEAIGDAGATVVDGIGDGAEWIGDTLGLTGPKLPWHEIQATLMSTAPREYFQGKDELIGGGGA